MQVDRARFFFLTTVIAAASCGRTGPAQSPSSDDSGEGDPSEPTVIGLDPGSEQGETITPVSNDDSGKPTNLEAICRSLKGPPGPSCENIDQTPNECLLYERTLKPIAAKQATHCLAIKSGRESICSVMVPGICFIEGARTATRLPASDQPCQELASKCRKIPPYDGVITLDDCRAVYSAVKPQYVSALLSCMNEGGCFGLGDCMRELE